jgi:hypothetical protein
MPTMARSFLTCLMMVGILCLAPTCGGSGDDETPTDTGPTDTGPADTGPADGITPPDGTVEDTTDRRNTSGHGATRRWNGFR